MKKFILPIICILAVFSPAMGLELTVSPGSLAGHVSELRYLKDDTLRLRGSADVTDLEYLKYLPASVLKLDLSDLSIEAYKFESGNYMGLTEFEKNEIPPYIFLGSNFSEIMLPADVTKIGNHAFSGSAITVIKIPSSVATIGDYAFSDCDRIETVDLSAVENIGVGVFKGCHSLKGASLPDEISYVPDYTFDGCSSFVSAVPKSVVVIGDYAYRSTAFEILRLENVRKVGEYSFADMPNLRTVIFNDDFAVETSVGSFFNDTSLASLPRIDSDLTPLVFSHSSGDARYYINSEVIGDGAFANATVLDTIHLGSGVREIQKNAFRNINTLNMVDVKSLGSSVPEVDTDAFSGLENDNGRYDIKLNVTKNTENAWNEHPVWSLFDVGTYYTGVETPSYADVEIEITGHDNRLTVRSSAPIDLIEVFSLDGQSVCVAKSAGNVHTVDCDLSQPKIVRVLSGGIVRIEKIM